jgi:hypothetical protein
MAASQVEDIDMGMQAIIDEINTETGHVDIGIHAEESEELLIIAGANEFGTKNIPARPYIRGAIDTNETELMGHANALSDMILAGTMTKYNALVEMGQLIEGMTKRYMINLSEPPNAPATIKAKGEDNPLIDKGHLMGAVRYVVKPGAAA